MEGGSGEDAYFFCMFLPLHKMVRANVTKCLFNSFGQRPYGDLL